MVSTLAPLPSTAEAETIARSRLAELRAQRDALDARTPDSEQRLTDLATQIATTRATLASHQQHLSALPDTLANAKANLLVMTGTAGEAPARRRVDELHTLQAQTSASAEAAQATLDALLATEATERDRFERQCAEDAAAGQEISALIAGMEAQIAELHEKRAREVLASIQHRLGELARHADEARELADAAEADLAAFRSSIADELANYPEVIREAQPLLPVVITPAAKALQALIAYCHVLEAEAKGLGTTGMAQKLAEQLMLPIHEAKQLTFSQQTTSIAGRRVGAEQLLMQITRGA